MVDGWSVRFSGFDAARMHRRESVLSIGNGYFCTRGAFEEGYPGDGRATLAHGIFDSAPVVHRELVSMPDWLALDVLLDDERFSLATGTVLGFEQALDLASGLLTRSVRWESPQGRVASLVFERFASMDDQHAALLRVRVIPEFHGSVEVRGWVDGFGENGHPGCHVSHLVRVSQDTEADITCLVRRTRTSGITIATAMRLVAGSGDCVRSELWDVMDRPTRTLLMKAKPGSEIVVEKHVAIATSRDAPPDRLASLTRSSLGRIRGWTEALGTSTGAWAREWARCDVVIEGDDRAQLAIRHGIYQLLIAGPRTDDSVNIGAKTLSGFGYRGHAFWDTESFMLPFFTFTSPRIARNLLTSRSRQLPAAQAKARQAGYGGAQFPWESADTGEEVTPSWLPDPSDPTRLQRIWTGDLEIHISADVAIAVYRYWQVTGDDAWFAQRGAEIVLGTAAFWASRAEWSADRSACGYRGVIGPDEYHEHVDHNHFTNALARWNLRAGSEVWDWLGSWDADRREIVSASLGITGHDIGRWRTIVDAMYLPVGGDGLIEQFDGYFELRDPDPAEFSAQARSMQATLGVEGVQETQIIKQPDVLAAMHLLPEAYDDRQVVANYRYYAARTDRHGSSLGPATMAIVASRAGLAQEAYGHFMEAALIDLEDIRGNTAHGIHGAAAGGAWQALVLGFAGLRLTREGYSTEARLPPHWTRLQIRFTHRGVPQVIDMKGDPGAPTLVSTTLAAVGPAVLPVLDSHSLRQQL